MNKKGPQAGEPFSKWQILVEETRTEKCLAIRALAEITLIPSGTLFNWLRAKTGVPSFTRYKPPVNKRMADALGIKPDTLWEAYQHSLKTIPSPPGPAPQSQGNPPAGNSVLQEDVTPYSLGSTNDRLTKLLSLLQTTGRSTFTLQEIQILASMIEPD